MSYFDIIKLENFRNFISFESNFTSSCNILIGKNGSGKTNLLESISLFEKGRGFRKDNLTNFVNTKSKKNSFKISSIFIDNNIKINLSLSNNIENNRFSKKLLVNNSASKDSVQHFENLFSLIYFLPEMERLFLTSPSIRRNFLDRLVYNHDKDYNKTLNSYKKSILERQKILSNYNFDTDWLKNLEKNIVNLGIEIYKKRITHLSVINKNLINLKKINNKNYRINLFFKDELINNNISQIDEISEIYLSKLIENRNLDSIIGGCKIGPHKTDILGKNIENNMNLNQFSTGQQKTIILLIILAQCQFLINEAKINPIILFDEVCSHLDEDNREILLDIIESLNVQTFMTGTEKNFFSFLSTKASYYNIS